MKRAIKNVNLYVTLHCVTLTLIGILPIPATRNTIGTVVQTLNRLTDNFNLVFSKMLYNQCAEVVTHVHVLKPPLTSR